MEYTLEELDGLLLEKERAFLAAERELGGRGEALAAARLELQRLQADVERQQRALEAQRGRPGSLRRALTNVLDRLIAPAESA